MSGHRRYIKTGGRQMTALVTAPDQGLTQRRKALEGANYIRVFRKDMKGKLKRREVRVVSLVQCPPPELHTMTAFDLLRAAPYVGPVKARSLMKRAGGSASLSLAALTPRQRDQLVVLLNAEVR